MRKTNRYYRSNDKEVETKEKVRSICCKELSQNSINVGFCENGKI